MRRGSPTARILIAAHPELLTPVLRIIHRVIAGFLLKQAGLRRATADTGAVTLIQRFGSAANLNIHLHCLVLDGVYRRTGGEPVFHQARAPTGDELADLLDKIIARLMKLLTRQGYLVKEEGVTYLADRDADNPLASLQTASCSYRSGAQARRWCCSCLAAPTSAERKADQACRCIGMSACSSHATGWSP